MAFWRRSTREKSSFSTLFGLRRQVLVRLETRDSRLETRQEDLVPAVTQPQLTRLTVAEVGAVGAVARVVGVLSPGLAVSHLGRKVVAHG